MTDQTEHDGQPEDSAPPISPTRPCARTRLILAAAALLAVGGASGAMIVHMTRPTATMAPSTPTAIGSLTAGNDIVTIRGRVTEIYGGRFVMADPTGRTLVNTGHGDRNAGLVALGQTVTVQGRFDDGNVRAAFLVGADGKVTSLGPMRGKRGHHGRDHDGHGLRGGDGAFAPPSPAPTPAPSAS